MRNAILFSFLTGVLLVGAAAVQAQPPTPGTYTSPGDFDEGTGTSSTGGAYLGVGSVLYGRSYNGGFTNDWTISCPTVTAVVPLGPPIGNNGNYTYMFTYSGGFVTLGGPGTPWGNGDPVYTGVIDTYIEIRTIQVAGGAASPTVRGWTSDHSVSAHIQGYPESCVAWAIGNGVLRGGTNTPQAPKPFNYTIGPSQLQSVKPANYPDYPGVGCALSPNGSGHWEDIKDLTVTIQGCAVATEQSSWGNVKSMYRK
jgi:hypothetical protein